MARNNGQSQQTISCEIYIIVIYNGKMKIHMYIHHCSILQIGPDTNLKQVALHLVCVQTTVYYAAVISLIKLINKFVALLLDPSFATQIWVVDSDWLKLESQSPTFIDI